MELCAALLDERQLIRYRVWPVDRGGDQSDFGADRGSEQDQGNSDQGPSDYRSGGDPDPLYDDCGSFDQVGLSGKNIGDLLNAKNLTWGWFQGGFKPSQP